MNTLVRLRPSVELSPKVAVYGAVGVFTLGLMGSASYAESRLTDSRYGAQAASDLLEHAGYQHPHLSGVEHLAVNMRGCDRADDVKYDFVATSPSGHSVQVAVCKGLFKPATIHHGESTLPR